MDKILRKLYLLTLSFWGVSEIQEYFDCGKTYATKIKNLTESKYGTIPVDSDNTQTRVSSENVIKMFGGKDRLTESNILRNCILKGEQ